MDWKKLMIEHLNHTYSKLCDTLDSVDPTMVVHPESGWRVQDIVGHLAAWYRERIMALQAWQAGQEYLIPNYDTTSYNQRAYEARRHLSYSKIAAEFQSAHEELIAILQQIPEDYFSETIRYPWGETGMIGHLIERLIVHEREHLHEIAELQQ
jgi:hypothetical protein